MSFLLVTITFMISETNIVTLVTIKLLISKMKIINSNSVFDIY